MKFHALALCAAVLAASVPARADHEPGHKSNGRAGGSTNGYYTSSDTYYYTNPQKERELMVDPVTGYSLYAGEWIYQRQVLFPEVPPKREVAAKVAEIIQAQRQEAAQLMALAPRARTAGFTNVSTVYDHMAQDHMKLVEFASGWLTQHGYPVPPQPVVATVTETSPEASVEHQIHMHQQAMNKMLDARKGERSSTVRTLQLWAATTATRHISLLNTLDRDIEIGRKSLSARLEAQLSGTLVASSSQSELMTRIIEEERIYFQSLNPPPPPYVPPPVQVAEQPAPPPAAPAPPVVAAPPPAPAAPRVVQAPPPAPAPVVQRPSYRPSARVAGRRDTRRRRPAH